MFVFPTHFRRTSAITLLAVLLSAPGRLSAQDAPPPRPVEGMMHTDWLALPARTAADLLRKAKFNRTDAGSLREEVLRVIKSGQGRIAVQDALRLRAGQQVWSAGTERQLPQTYTCPRIAKDITVNMEGETTHPEPALVQTTMTVFTGRRSPVELSRTADDGMLWGQGALEWLTSQGNVIWGQGYGAKAFPVTHGMALNIHGPLRSGNWSFAGMVTPPVPEEKLADRTGAVFARASRESMLVFVRAELDPVPDQPAVPPAQGEGESPGCLLEWLSMDDATSADLLERFPSFADPGLYTAVAELAARGKVELSETLWVPTATPIVQRVGSTTTFPVPSHYELITPWRIHRTSGPLLSLGPVRKPFWLAPEPMQFERSETGRRVTMEGGTLETTDGLRTHVQLEMNCQQLTGMMPVGLPGLEIAAAARQGNYESVNVMLVPGRPTVVRTFEAPAQPSTQVLTAAPVSGRKCWLILTAAEGRK